MKKFTLITLCSFMVLLLSRCSSGGDDVVNPSMLDLPDDVAELFEKGLALPTEGGTQSMKFTALDSWSFSVDNVVKAEDITWCSVEPASGGAGEVEVTVKVDPNDTSDDRSAELKLTIGGEAITMNIEQVAEDTFTVSPLAFSPAVEGESVEFTLETNMEYTIFIDEKYDWIVADESSDLKYTILANTTFEQRIGYIIFKREGKDDISVSVTQAGAEYTPQRLYLFDPYPTEAGYPVLDIDPELIENRANRVNLVDDYGAKADGVTDDSALLNQAITDINADPDGGIVYLPLGNYVLNEIILKSNVHLHIEAGSKISLPVRDYTGNKVLFSLGTACDTGEYDSNVLLSGVTNGVFDIKTNGRFDIDLITNGAEDLKKNSTDCASPRNIQCNDVHHFYVGNINIYDMGTEMAHVTFSPNEDQDPNVFGPTNGVIQNISSYGCHYGYGTVQAQAAKKIYFNNLYGEGGVVLRFETGLNSMNTTQFGGVHDCKGYGIAGKDGNATVMISPHAMHNGIVQVSNITAESMAIGVRMDGGYEFTDDYDIVHEAGTYEVGTYVADIVCTYGTNSQLKSKHFQYMPNEIRYSDGWNSNTATTYTYNYSNGNTRTTPYYYPAPSACSVLLTAEIPSNSVVWSSVTGIGYNYFDNENGWVNEVD